ncbi:MAG TPA: YcgL domain-containing protein [Candidatus Competibacteraceae bacterium]|nr:YcgL domain-containing protein [Candidatus Competibacteraceae bacterium]HPF59506.1 YcgL domain-containing protein [Candidatus Competibacteraceae bacterium]HRY19274.1 YcgL domain-containing protein [Candidatus Competibacteraceae bacterium]
MQCSIYKSRRKQDTYLYLAIKDDFSRLPGPLLKLLGEPVHVMDLELHPERRLAQENTAEVLHNLQQRGWHLQMPRQEWPETEAKH